MKKYLTIIITLLTFLFISCSDPSSSEEPEEYFIKFTLNGKNYTYKKGMNVPPFNKEDAALFYYPDGYHEGYGAQYHFIGCKNIITNNKKFDNAITIGFWKEDKWKWAINLIRKNDQLSSTENMQVSAFPFDTTLSDGANIVGKIEGEYKFTSGPYSDNIIKNISFSLIRNNFSTIK